MGIMKKRWIGILMAVLLLVEMPAAVCFAANPAEKTVSVENTQEEIAVQLHALGLFRGVSDTDFALDRAPTKVETIVMLVRLLGKETTAMEADYTHPFTDVPAWANAYVAYAYQTGWVKGVAADRLGDEPAGCMIYLTFVLRALGYSEGEDGDFLWNDPFTCAADAGIVSTDVSVRRFTRRDVVTVSWLALSARVQNTEKTLAETLEESGVITKEAYESAQTALSLHPVTAVYFDAKHNIFAEKIADFPKLEETLGDGREENPIPVPTDPTLQKK